MSIYAKLKYNGEAFKSRLTLVKIGANRYPNMFLSTTGDVLDDESGKCPPFAHPSAIAKEKAGTFRGRLSFPSFRGGIGWSDGPDIPLGIFPDIPLGIFRIHWLSLGDCTMDIFLVTDGAAGMAHWHRLLR